MERPKWEWMDDARKNLRNIKINWKRVPENREEKMTVELANTHIKL